MKLFVGGSRKFDMEPNEIYITILDHVRNLGRHDVELIIHGGAQGVDLLAEDVANEVEIPTKCVRPDWNKHGKAAGIIRNQEMIDECDCGLLVWNGSSRGTQSSLNMLIKSGKPFVLHRI